MVQVLLLYPALADHQLFWGNVWVGTRDGLNLFQEATNTFSLFTKKEGLPHNTVLTLLKDDEHQLWLSTPNGLSNAQINRSQIESKGTFISFRNFSVSDGLQGNASSRSSK